MFEELTPEQAAEVRRVYDDTERYRAAVTSPTYEEYLKRDEERQMQQDYNVYGDNRQGSVEVLARVWHNIMGETAEYSRPVAIVNDQLIIEVDRGKSFGARDMARALDALGREEVDRIGIRVVEPKREQTLSRGMGR
jgi:hypothetical protein